MLTRLRGKNEEGFTLIELMVVVLIIAILIAIAIPTFIGMRDRGYDSQTKSNLRNGITAAKTYFTDNESYTGMDAAALDAIESAVPFSDDAAAGCTAQVTGAGADTLHATVDVFTAVASGDTACLAAWTKGTDAWYYFSTSGSTETLVVR